MFTRDHGAPFDTPNAVIGSQGRNELTLSFRPAPYLHRLLRNEHQSHKSQDRQLLLKEEETEGGPSARYRCGLG